MNILLTGGAGFLGELLKKKLLEEGHFVKSVDLEPDSTTHPNLIHYKEDIRNFFFLKDLCDRYHFDAIFHVAAILAHCTNCQNHLWSSNVTGTKNIAEIAKLKGIKKVVFTSSNCLWGKNFKRPVTEEEQPNPIEIYGESKLFGEKILKKYEDDFQSIIFRCPTIIDAGRLGLLSILFEFINEGKKVWVVGGGKNRYQFIYAQDLISAFLKTLELPDKKGSEIYNIGSDHVPTFQEAYQFVIDKSGNTKAKVASFPKKIAIPAMKLAYALKLSPLGPYQYKMIAEDFIFDTTKIKKELQWQPTLTNQEMLLKAYNYYHENISEIKNRENVSAHKQNAKMGIIKLLKWVS